MLLLRFYFSMGMNAEAAGSRTVSGVFASLRLRNRSKQRDFDREDISNTSLLSG